MHVEVVTLIIPGLNDSPEEIDALITWILEYPGPATPVHFTRFHPDYHMTDRAATPVATLEKIYKRAKEWGSVSLISGMFPLTRLNIPTALIVANC